MSARIPLRWPIPQVDQIKIGRAVRSPTILDIASAQGWALGRGAQLIPETSGTATVLTSGKRYTFGFRVRPRYQAVDRLWRVNAYGGTTATLAAPSGGTDQVVGFGASMGEAEPVGYVEELSSQSAAKADVTIDITPEDNDLEMLGISCVEIPRVQIGASTTELGFGVTQLRGNAPIVADSAAAAGDKGLYQLYDAIDDPADIGTRAGHFYWSVPYEEDGAEVTAWAEATTSGTFVDILLLDVPALHRRTALTAAGAVATQRTITVAALCKCSNGTTSGELRWTATSTGTVTVSVPTSTTTWTWFEDTVEIDVEDTGQESGLRGGAWDDIAQEFRRTAGIGTLYVAALCIFEND